MFNKAETDEDAANLVKEIEELIIDNKWIEYFKEVKIAQGWVDFEKEISIVIQTFDSVRKKLLIEHKKTGKGITLTNYEISVLKPFIGKNKTVFFNMSPIENWKSQLLKDLNRLTRCLEIYLSDYIQNIPIKNKLPDIIDLNIHAIVSFNYTDTYRKNYDATNLKKIDCDFIHGKADINHNINTCNMVIGIDEYLEGTEKNEDNEYIQFKKFFQRIYKATGNKYLDWLDKIKIPQAIAAPAKPNQSISNIYIYGHSLDTTDKDILATLIKADKVKTTIFYHNQEALEQQIINLVKVISEDELIRRTGNKNIVFKEITKL